MKKSNQEHTAWVISVAMVVVLLASGVPALADSDDRRPDGHCSNATLNGDYGWAAQGLASLGPNLPPQAPFTAVGVAHFDGKGNLSWIEHTIIAGMLQGAPWTMATGTYTVNANCTVMATVNTPNSPVPLSLALAVTKGGKEIHMVVDGHAISAVFVRNDD